MHPRIHTCIKIGPSFLCALGKEKLLQAAGEVVHLTHLGVRGSGGLCYKGRAIVAYAHE